MTAASVRRVQAVFLAGVVFAGTAAAQTTSLAPIQTRRGLPAPVAPADDQSSALASAQQTAEMLGLDRTIQRVRQLQASTQLTEEERSLRLELLESIQIASLEVDQVLGEISNERNELGDIRASLQRRRDKSVGRFTTAALITGSGLGIVVSAAGYSSLGRTTNNAGDTLGIVSGVASTTLSIIAARRQKGPSASVGNVPNMLAPLLGGTPILSTYYPPAVLQYLQTIPPGDESHSTRLELLKRSWIQSGRLDSSNAKTLQRTTTVATSSDDPSIKISIDDLTNRMAMLGDVEGRVSLMKRDLSVLMRSYTEDLQK